jgi:hypothetical protein
MHRQEQHNKAAQAGSRPGGFHSHGKLGFEEMGPYRFNPYENAIYLRLDLILI